MTCPQCNRQTPALFKVDWHPGVWCAKCQDRAAGCETWWLDRIAEVKTGRHRP